MGAHVVSCMRQWVLAHFDPGKPLRIVDIGARDGERMRRLFGAASWRYVGYDIAKGPNVDVLLEDPYKWKGECAPRDADLVVMYCMLEHVPLFWVLLLAVDRVVVGGGHILIAVPKEWPAHKPEPDAWRFRMEALRVIAEWLDWEVVELAEETIEQGKVLVCGLFKKNEWAGGK